MKKNLLNEIKKEGPDFLFKAAGAIAGVMLCRIGKTQVFKLAKDPSTGKWVNSDGSAAGFKKFIPAAVVTVAGFAGKLYVDNKIAKAIAEGMAIGGLIDGVTIVFNKATLQGFGLNGLLGEGELEGSAPEMPIQVNTYEPSLQDLQDLNEGKAEDAMLLTSASAAGMGDLYDDSDLAPATNPLAKEMFS